MLLKIPFESQDLNLPGNLMVTVVTVVTITVVLAKAYLHKAQN